MSNAAPIVDRIRIIPRPDDFLDRNVGSSGEVFFNKQSNSLRVYSGKDRSGFEIARADLSNVDPAIILKPTDLNSLSIEEFSDVMYMPNPLPEDGQVLVWRTDHWMNETLAVSGGASVDVSDTAPTDPQAGNLWLDTNTGKLYIYYDDGDTAQWIQPSASNGGGASGGSTNALTLNGQLPSYYLNYTNFTNTPTVPSSILDLGIADGNNGQVLTTDGAGNFAFTTVSGGGGGGGVDLTALSVTENSASGGGTLSYNNLTGVFTYTPPDLSSYLTAESDTLSSVTARGASTNDPVSINNTLTVDVLETSGTGNPELTSASTITLTAPDGVIMTDGGSSVEVDAGNVRLGATLSQSPAISNVTGISLDTNGTAQFSRNTSTFADGVIYTNKNGNVGEHIQIRRPGFGGPQRVGAIGESTTGNQLGLFNQTSDEVAKTGALGIVFSSYTTTERNAATAVAGEVIFNTTAGKLQVYDGGNWLDLH